RIPAGRWGTPADFAGPVVFLASPASQYVCGELLVVDGVSPPPPLSSRADGWDADRAPEPGLEDIEEGAGGGEEREQGPAEFEDRKVVGVAGHKSTALLDIDIEIRVARNRFSTRFPTPEDSRKRNESSWLERIVQYTIYNIYMPAHTDVPYDTKQRHSKPRDCGERHATWAVGCGLWAITSHPSSSSYHPPGEMTIALRPRKKKIKETETNCKEKRSMLSPGPARLLEKNEKELEWGREERQGFGWIPRRGKGVGVAGCQSCERSCDPPPLEHSTETIHHHTKGASAHAHAVQSNRPLRSPSRRWLTPEVEE
ncbi:hypothetical protein EW146_g7445, partial [Bondarzewia mesenterica]